MPKPAKTETSYLLPDTTRFDKAGYLEITNSSAQRMTVALRTGRIDVFRNCVETVINVYNFGLAHLGKRNSRLPSIVASEAMMRVVLDALESRSALLRAG